MKVHIQKLSYRLDGEKGNTLEKFFLYASICIVTCLCPPMGLVLLYIVEG